MSSNIPNPIKIYHIVHLDKLPFILQAGGLLCDAVIQQHSQRGTTIGMQGIKDRRMTNSIPTYPNLKVGQCVPFYFCPRSIMLFLIHKQNQELSYRGGQEPIIHLVADMYDTINWAVQHNLRWVFTSSNAGAFYFNSYNNLADLTKIDWNAVNEQQNWSPCKHGKQAEFLLEQQFPWHLVEQIGVYSATQSQQISHFLAGAQHQPVIDIKPDWYY